MTDTDTPTIELPEIVFDEDGETAYAPGHVDPALFMLALVIEARRDWHTTDFDSTLLGGPTRFEAEVVYTRHDQLDHLAGLTAEVRHVAFRPDPDDEEIMLVCEPDHPEAQAWTRLHL